MVPLTESFTKKKLFKEIITPLDFNSSLMRRMKLVKLARLLLISRTFIFSRATKQHITQNIYFLHKGKFQCTADRQPDYFGFNWGGESDVNLIIAKLLIPNQSNQGTFIVGGRITVQLVSSLTRLDLTKEENMFFVCNEATESKLVKLETSRAVILPPKVGVLWSNWRSVVYWYFLLQSKCTSFASSVSQVAFDPWPNSQH